MRQAAPIFPPSKSLNRHPATRSFGGSALTLLLILTCLLLFSACKGGREAQRPNLSALYGERATAALPQLKIYHISADSTRIYAQTYEEGQKSILLLSDQASGSRVDSLLINTRQSTSTIHFPINATYQLQHSGIYTSSVRSESYLQKSSRLTENDFLIRHADDQSICFNNYITEGESINISCARADVARYKVYFYSAKNELPPPTFLPKKAPRPPRLSDADSTFVHPVNKSLQLSNNGRYYIEAIKQDDQALGGICLLSMPNGFPKLTKATDLIDALRYTTRLEEFAALIEAKDTKSAVDDLWLKRAGSTHRGRVLIKEYYGRVQRANQFFSTFKPGWQSDRGLVFIIYGQPNEVYHYPDREVWNYQARRDISSLRFVFAKVPNELTSASYLLSRDPFYEDSWHRAVYEWRKGVISNLSKQ